MKLRHFILLILLVFIFAPNSYGQVPHTLNYQGRLHDSLGNPVADDIYDITFSIYNSPADPSHLWQETLAVEVTDGYFEVVLGTVTPFDELFFVNGPELFLGVKVGSDLELIPRTPITASGFSLHSELSDISLLALGLEPGTITDEHIVDGEITLPKLNQSGASEGQVIKWMSGEWVTSEDESGGLLELPYDGVVSGPPDAFSVYNTGAGAGIRGRSDGNDGVVGWTAEGEKSGVYGYSDYGIGVSGRCGADNHGVYGESHCTSPEYAGVRGTNFGAGPGVSAYGDKMGLYATSPDTAGLFEGAVYVEGYQESHVDTGTTAYFNSDFLTLENDAVLNIEYDDVSDPSIGFPTGIKVDCRDPDRRSIGGSFVSNGIGLVCHVKDSIRNNHTQGLYCEIGFGGDNCGASFLTISSPGEVQADYNHGVKCSISDAVTNCGIYAIASDDSQSAPTPKRNYGIIGKAMYSDSVGSGIVGEASYCDSTYGAYMSAWGGNVNIGIYAAAPTALLDWAGYFNGDVNVTNAIYAASKYYRIDHPHDPENRYLTHACIESSEMLNVYSGTIILDGRGEALVNLPDYFEDINTDYRYQLTPIGDPAPNLYIAEEIVNNHFRIAGGKEGMKISWQVTGVRDDPYAQSHPMQVETEKHERERGKYLHPEAYGLDESYGLHQKGRSVISEGAMPKRLEISENK
jgi:hypothetical protein